MVISRTILAASLGSAAGHMYTLDPPPRQARYVPGVPAGAGGSCPAGNCFWFNEGCTIGCPNCTGPSKSLLIPDGACGADQGSATLPDYARSKWFSDDPSPIRMKDCGINPWCAPGSSPVESPCGIAGGDPHQGAAGAGGTPPYGSKQGDDARDLPELDEALFPKTIWKAGSVAEVSWAVIANHGGGYQYRLCPKQPHPTEECFQQTPIKFHGNESYIQWVPVPETGIYDPYADPEYLPKFQAPDPENRTAIPLVTVSEGTVPAGSTWARNPIPHCKAMAGGAFGNVNLDGSCPEFQFPPAIADRMRPGQQLGGFGAGSCYGAFPLQVPKACEGIPSIWAPQAHDYANMWHLMLSFNIVDKIVVPDVPPGEYIMSARWDNEQTAQIWTGCSDVTITAGEVQV